MVVVHDSWKGGEGLAPPRFLATQHQLFWVTAHSPLAGRHSLPHPGTHSLTHHADRLTHTGERERFKEDSKANDPKDFTIR